MNVLGFFFLYIKKNRRTFFFFIVHDEKTFKTCLANMLHAQPNLMTKKYSLHKLTVFMNKVPA